MHTVNTPARSRHGYRGELLVVVQFLIVSAFVLAPRWPTWTDAELFGATAIERLAALGVLSVAAVVMAVLGVVQIRRYLTPLPYPVDHNRLVTNGVYSLVRHPLYSSHLVAALGWTCFTLSLTHLILLVIGFAFFDYKAGREEHWLTERHPEYSTYAERVPKLIPWLY